MRILTPGRRILTAGRSILKVFEAFWRRPSPAEAHFPLHFFDFSSIPRANARGLEKHSRPGRAAPVGSNTTRFKNANRTRKLVARIVSFFPICEMRVDLSIPAKENNTFFDEEIGLWGPAQFFRRSRRDRAGPRWTPALSAGPAGASLRILTPGRRILTPGRSILKVFEAFRRRPSFQKLANQ